MANDTLPKPQPPQQPSFNSNSFNKISTPTNSFQTRPQQLQQTASFRQPSPFLASNQNKAASIAQTTTDSSQTNIVKTQKLNDSSKPTENTTTTTTAATSTTSGSKSPKFFLGDDDSNSSDAPAETTTTTKQEAVEADSTSDVTQKQAEVTPKLEAKVGGSWSLLKNASKTTTTSSSGSLADTTASSSAVDSFQKYKMQLLEKEKMLREQETLKAQREKDQLKPTVNLDDNKPSPAASLSNQPISPVSINNPISSDLDSNSQLSPQQQPQSTEPDVEEPAKQEAEQQAAQPAAAASDAIKRVQSIQEMREKERRRREEIAGKIDMTEQHKLISQFEQNFAPPPS